VVSLVRSSDWSGNTIRVLASSGLDQQYWFDDRADPASVRMSDRYIVALVNSNRPCVGLIDRNGNVSSDPFELTSVGLRG
jgi:hypothetical protein